MTINTSKKYDREAHQPKSGASATNPSATCKPPRVIVPPSKSGKLAADARKRASPPEVERDRFGALKAVPGWLRVILDDLDGTAWSTGIESDRRGRGSAINASVYSYSDGEMLAVVQVREAVFDPRRYTRVRKDYYLIGRNENGLAFAHPIPEFRRSARIQRELTAGVRIALAKIWGCDEDDLSDIVRNGDVAFVPVDRLPSGATLVESGEGIVRESHHLGALGNGKLYRAGDDLYATGRARLDHAKHQHPTARVRGGVWRVVAGGRGRVWGFSRPTAD